MKKDRKQEKFHESLLKILYPPLPLPPQEDCDEEQKKKLLQTLYHLPEDLENEERDELSSSNDERGEGNEGSAKLTRAQRKRLRKKKLKEAASQRRKLIGPLLPDSPNDGTENVPDSVGQNAPVETNTTAGSSGDPAWSSKQNKLKQRRKFKKLAAGDSKSSTVETDASRTGPDSRELND